MAARRDSMTNQMLCAWETKIPKKKSTAIFALPVLVWLLPIVGRPATYDYEFHLTATSSNPNIPMIVSGTIHYDSSTAYLGWAFQIATITNTPDAYAGTQLFDNGGNLIFGQGARALGASLTQSNLLFSFGLDPTDPTSKEILYLSDADGVPLPTTGRTVALTNCVIYAQDSSGAVPGSAQYYSGTISNVAPPMPALAFTLSGRQLVTSWPTSFQGLTLQYATNLPASAWTAVATTPAVVGQQFAVTNPISAGNRFYRLMK